MVAQRQSSAAAAGHSIFMMHVVAMILHIAIFNDSTMASGGPNHFEPALMQSSKEI
jgi:hypothetical protein